MGKKTARQENIDSPYPDFFSKLGIMQGRLSHSPQNILSYFPQDNWKNEFLIAQRIGLSHIEVIAEEDFNVNNPLWSRAGRNLINNLRKESGVNVMSACNNFPIKNSILQQKTIQDFVRFIENVSEIGVVKVILPLFEASEPTSTNSKGFVICLRTLADFAAYHNTQLCCETRMNGKSMNSFLKDINHENKAVCYDIGNCTYFGHDIEEDMVILNRRIQHIHFKDRNVQGDNVVLGAGLVNFPKFFKALKAIDFQGAYTLETNRESDPTETAIRNMNFLQEFI